MRWVALSMCTSLLAERSASDEPEICNLICADVLTLLPASAHVFRSCCRCSAWMEEQQITGRISLMSLGHRSSVIESFLPVFSCFQGVMSSFKVPHGFSAYNLSILSWNGSTWRAQVRRPDQLGSVFACGSALPHVWTYIRVPALPLRKITKTSLFISRSGWKVVGIRWGVIQHLCCTERISRLGWYTSSPIEAAKNTIFGLQAI